MRTDTRRYVNWKPEFIDHLRIRHGQRLSGDWPRLAYVRRLGGNLRSMDTVVDDWPHIRTKTLILGGEIDGPDFPDERAAGRRDPPQRGGLSHPERWP